VVHDGQGGTFPGVTVAVRDEATQRAITVVTDAAGSFHIESLVEGSYRVDVLLTGLRPAKIEHLQLNAGEVIRANIGLRLDTTCTVVVGALAASPAANSEVSMTFTQDFVNKLPL